MKNHKESITKLEGLPNKVKREVEELAAYISSIQPYMEIHKVRKYYTEKMKGQWGYLSAMHWVCLCGYAAVVHGDESQGIIGYEGRCPLKIRLHYQRSVSDTLTS